VAEQNAGRITGGCDRSDLIVEIRAILFFAKPSRLSLKKCDRPLNVMQTAAINTQWTPAEYLALEEKAEFRSEYHDGKIIPMTGGSFNHNRIINRICAYLLTALHDKSYEPFSSDVRLWIPKYRKFTYPDVMVVQGQPIPYENRTDTLVNPRLIFEVLYKSTEEYDQGDKFKFYRSIPSLQEYVLINQYELEIQHYARTDSNFWLYRPYEATDDVLALNAIDVEITIADIYEGISFETTPCLND
jgi:Uma2 family endonuclease